MTNCKEICEKSLDFFLQHFFFVKLKAIKKLHFLIKFFFKEYYYKYNHILGETEKRHGYSFYQRFYSSGPTSIQENKMI